MKKLSLSHMAIVLVASLLIFISCKKEEAVKEKRDFFSCKIDGESFGKENLADAPYAEYDATTSPKRLRIMAKTNTIYFIIYVYDQSDYTGAFQFGDEVPGYYYHVAVITPIPGDYVTDSWFATGDAVNAGHSGGSVTISSYDTVKHHIEGTFEGTFYNSYNETSLVVTEGKFFLPLIKKD